MTSPTPRLATARLRSAPSLKRQALQVRSFSHTLPSWFAVFCCHCCGTDAFEDAGDKGGVSSEEKVHVRVQQRNGRKCITTVAGLADDLDIKRICKAFKKNFSCNGAVQKDEEVGEVIQLSGDQRTNVKSFLVDQEICHTESVVLHGF